MKTKEKLSAWQVAEIIALVRAEVNRTPAGEGGYAGDVRVLLTTLEDAQYLYISRYNT